MSINNKIVKGEANMAVVQTGNEVTQAMVAKEQATIQGQVFMAKQFPRDMGDVMNRVTSSCERISLAEISEYEYPRGGQKITGASIRLLEVIAQCYGNLSFSWKEVIRDMTNHKSTVIAYAWDLETNLRSELEFDVPHYRVTRTNRTLLTDDRDIYELVANQASRRVRRCLENVIPRDIVDDAREMCKETLETKVDYQDKIDKAIKYFETEHNIKLKQIEEYFGMSRRAFSRNTYIALQKIFISVRDGMSKVEDYFKNTDIKSSHIPNITDKKEVKKTVSEVQEEQNVTESTNVQTEQPSLI